MFFWTHSPPFYLFIKRNKVLTPDIRKSDELLKKSDLLLCTNGANNIGKTKQSQSHGYFAVTRRRFNAPQQRALQITERNKK